MTSISSAGSSALDSKSTRKKRLSIAILSRERRKVTASSGEPIAQTLIFKQFEYPIDLDRVMGS